MAPDPQPSIHAAPAGARILPGAWPGLPHLRALVTYPVYGPGWQRIAGQGYHPGTGIFRDLNGLAVPPVAENPTDGDLAEAKRLLILELLHDFSFADDVSLTNALAMLILPIVRNAIDGPTPLGVIDAPTEGIGKNFLAEVIALVTVGGLPEAMSPDMDDTEWNKALLALLADGQPLIDLDNANRKLDSGLRVGADRDVEARARARRDPHGPRPGERVVAAHREQLPVLTGDRPTVLLGPDRRAAGGAPARGPGSDTRTFCGGSARTVRDSSGRS